MNRCAGIVLAGGRSSRMGRPKAALPWHGQPLLDRVARLLLRVFPEGPVVVVRAPGQDLPALPGDVRVVEDEREGRGPLEGIAAGLAAVAGEADAAYVSSTDVPFLHPAFVTAVVDALEGHDIAVPRAGGRHHPLAAAYRVSVLPAAEGLLAADRLRPAFLFDEARTRFLEEPELRTVDPELRSLRNLNEPADYAEALALPEPAVHVERYGTLRPAGANGPVLVHGGTLGAVAAAVGIELDGHVVAALNGDQISRDPFLPLADGDVVSLLSADAGG